MFSPVIHLLTIALTTKITRFLVNLCVQVKVPSTQDDFVKYIAKSDLFLPSGLLSAQ